jgi:aminoglycoside/choline kinase family phosphotransferase
MGEGSLRAYYRLRAGGKKYVVMVGPDGFENMKFFTLGLAFNNMGFAFPKLYDLDPTLRFVIMDDLGDARLDRIEELGIDPFTIYPKVAGALALFHNKALKSLWRRNLPSPDHYSLDFSIIKEFNYFLDGLDLIGFPYESDTKLHLEGLMFSLFQFSYSKKKNVLIHRDFQSRNIMIIDDEPYFLDWQGVMAGPFQYDLASLIYDPYVTLPEELTDCILSAYARRSDLKLNIDELRTEVMVFGAKRLFQAFGAYANLSQKLGKNQFTPFMKVAAERLNKIFSLKLFFPFQRLSEMVRRLDAFLKVDPWLL